MTFDASSEIVLATTARHPSSNALPITFAFVPGGPEPMTKGLGSFRPLTVVSSVGIFLSAEYLHQDEVDHERQAECKEPCVRVNTIPHRAERARTDLVEKA